MKKLTKKDFKASLPKDREVLIYRSDEQWHDFRQRRIGGSDAGAILGVNPYKSIIDVYIDKTEGSSFKGNEATYWGQTLERVVAEEFEKLHQDEFEVFTTQCSVVTEEFIANVDAVLKDKDGNYGILEIKTTNAFNKGSWEDDIIPQSYYCQVQHYLMMTGYKFAYIAVLIGGQHYKEFKVKRSEEDIKILKQACLNFYYENLEKKIPPMPDGSDAYMEYLKKKALEIEENTPIPLDEFEEKVERIKEIKEQIDVLKKEDNLLKEEILKEMIEQGSRKATIGDFKANIQGRKTVDKETLAKDHPNVFKALSEAEKEYKALEKNYKIETTRYLVIR